MTPAPFAGLKHAPTAVYLPACKYGCGEMLMTDEGYMCPICGRFMSYPRPPGHKTPAGWERAEEVAAWF